MKNVKLKITGKVQGVCYRYYAEKKAHELGLKGKIKNEQDGSVFVEVEGENEDLKKFLEWCYLGSPGSKVVNVKFETSDKLKNYQDFRIV